MLGFQTHYICGSFMRNIFAFMKGGMQGIAGVLLLFVIIGLFVKYPVVMISCLLVYALLCWLAKNA